MATCCKLAGAHPPPEVDKLKLGEESLYFQPERVPVSLRFCYCVLDNDACILYVVNPVYYYNIV